MGPDDKLPEPISTWSQVEIEAVFSDCQTLGAIIGRMEREFAARGEVICEVRVNGMALREEDELRFAECLRSEIQDLAVVTSSAAVLIEQALRSVEAFMGNFHKSCLEASQSIRDGGIGSAHKTFQEIIEGCQWAVETLIHARGAASGSTQPIAHVERWLEAERVLVATVRELGAAYERKDGALVADILEYEATGAAVIWAEALQREIASRAHATEKFPSGLLSAAMG